MRLEPANRMQIHFALTQRFGPQPNIKDLLPDTSKYSYSLGSHDFSGEDFQETDFDIEHDEDEKPSLWLEGLGIDPRFYDPYFDLCDDFTDYNPDLVEDDDTEIWDDPSMAPDIPSITEIERHDDGTPSGPTPHGNPSGPIKIEPAQTQEVGHYEADGRFIVDYVVNPKAPKLEVPYQQFGKKDSDALFEEPPLAEDLNACMGLFVESEGNK